MRFWIFIFLSLTYFNGFAQDCLKDYMPNEFQLSKTVIVIPSVKEFNERLIKEYKEKSPVLPTPFPWYTKEKKYNRRRDKLIKKLNNNYPDLNIYTFSEFKKISLDPINYVIEQKWIQHGHHGPSGTFVSTLTYEFIDLKGGIEFKPMFLHNDSIAHECLGKIKGTFEYFVLQNGR